MIWGNSWLKSINSLRGKERAKFRKRNSRERKKRFAVKQGALFVKWLGWGWFKSSSSCRECFIYLCFVLAILGAFKWAVFWLAGWYLCVITVSSRSPIGLHKIWLYRWLRQPGFWDLAEPLMELLNKTMPWHSYLFQNLRTKAPRTVAR